MGTFRSSVNKTIHTKRLSNLTDTQWEYIKELIPAAQRGGRPRSLDMCLVVNASLYILVGGI